MAPTGHGQTRDAESQDEDVLALKVSHAYLSFKVDKPTKHKSIFPWVKFEERMKVRTMRLDTFATQQKLKRVDFLWIDAQGCEGDVIAGGPETLKMTRYLFMECVVDQLYDNQPDARMLLASLPDFEVLARFPDDMLLRNRRLA